MVKGDLVDLVMEKTDLGRQKATHTVNTFLNAITQSLSEGEHVELRGFGSFRIRERKERMGRNPKTGESVKIPAKKIAVFKPGKELKESI